MDFLSNGNRGLFAYSDMIIYLSLTTATLSIIVGDLGKVINIRFATVMRSSKFHVL